MQIALIVLILSCIVGGSTGWAEEQTIMTDPTTGMEFVFVKGGCFEMGDVFGGGEKDETPVHEVCVSDYYIGKYEVTQGQFQKIKKEYSLDLQQCGLDCPVGNLSWKMVQDYISALNEKSSKQYRLPTEAEWEYAARSGGKKDKWAGTNSEAELTDFVNFNKSDDKAYAKVGSRKPNGLGIYDMSGNAQEWCQDWYHEDFYSKKIKDNPTGPSTGVIRVLRGGTFNDDKIYVRTTARNSSSPDGIDGGFRLVLPVK
ncbi:MAG: SUMF1/EgtB/PvdO family nonheme iron enzyme [Nitrospirae bacterium]|nr:SUMF1/EgtB/PvdO family nonheme iron enzyme [Nitrospirota bacterium]